MNEVVNAPGSTETDRLFRELDKPSLANLAYVLRHPETWPRGFVWNYSNCRSCAMGLAHRLWSRHVPSVGTHSGASVMARSFAMPFSIANRIFLKGWRARWFPMNVIPFGVTPECVADQIDAYLKRAE